MTRTTRPVATFAEAVTASVVSAVVVASIACTRSTLTAVETAADQAAAQGCDLVFLPTDPTLAPLCVGIADVVAAGAALGLDVFGDADAGVPDGGPGVTARALVLRDSVTNAKVYAWLVAHGAVRLGG
jgi:hypothetical protein